MRRVPFVIIVVVTLALASAPLFAVKPIRVHLEARPSDDCFGASSLQELELKEDFRRVCEECDTVATAREAEFDVIGEDPGAAWLLSVYDSKGSLLESLKWNGSLQNGLEKVTKIIRDQKGN